MLIINADDLGRNNQATDNIIKCFNFRAITSSSAMVFMCDSERAAEIVSDNKFEVGLHLNFIEPFSCNTGDIDLNDRLSRISSYLKKFKWSQLIYNPFLKNDFLFLFKSQYAEFVRLFKKPPTHIDGHHHMHLCMNALIGGIIPGGMCIRRNFSFLPGERNILNRFYRRVIDAWLEKHYRCTDFFYDICPLEVDNKRLIRIIAISRTNHVEIMTHPEHQKQYEYLLGEKFLEAISTVKKGSYSSL